MASLSYDILLIDDDAEVLRVTGELLRTHGLSVLTAQDPSSAMLQLDNKVGLIVLDVNLGGEDNLQLLDFIKLNHPDLPVILYTGMTHDNEQVRAMLDRVANCQVTKGEKFRDLLSAIKAIRG